MKKWECTVCGYIHEGEEPPDECPVCSADKSMFVEVIEEAAQGEPRPTPAEVASASSTVQVTFLGKLYTFASEQILKHHLHPIMVHTPNGILPMALIFLLITAFLRMPLFETAALYSFVFVFISMPLVIFTGYEVWQKRYRGAMTSTFKIKIGASIVTVVLLLTLIIWRAVQPDIMTTASNSRWVFLLLSLVVVGAVGAAGHLGGKLVFGARKNP
jgi:uncharacterized membrane protein/rubredoxin